MVYNYLLDLYQALDKRREEILRDKAPVDCPDPELYQQGRLAVIEEFVRFLRTGYHHKLPRRIQKKINQQLEDH